MTQVLSCKMKDENPSNKAYIDAYLSPMSRKIPTEVKCAQFALEKGLPMKTFILLVRKKRS